MELNIEVKIQKSVVEVAGTESNESGQRKSLLVTSKRTTRTWVIELIVEEATHTEVSQYNIPIP